MNDLCQTENLPRDVGCNGTAATKAQTKELQSKEQNSQTKGQLKNIRIGLTANIVKILSEFDTQNDEL
jgi:flagellar hook protein FlgE